MPKWMKWASGIFAAVLVVVGTWLHFRGDAAITSAVETYGSSLLGVRVSLGSSRLSMAGQSLELRDLTVGNPAGYRSPYLVHLGLVRVGLDVSTLASAVVRLREVTLLSPEVHFERRNGVSNFDAIERGLGNGGSGPAKRWIIDELVLRDCRANVHQELLVTRDLSVPVPSFHLRGIGERTGGISSADATRQVFHAFTASVGHAAGSAVAGGVKTVGAKIRGFFSR
jgi:hypothetical protein